MNFNYIGSLAERKIHFSSSVEVVINENNELFNNFSIYVPMSLAAANIAEFDSSWVSADHPAVISCDVNNYKKHLKGKLLDQWMNVFRQDTNIDVVLYVIVFLDDISTVGMWEIDDVSIKFEPLTKAFNKLFYISYIKLLFDEKYSGEDVVVPADPGAPASAVLTLSNPESSPLTVPAASYTFNDGVKDWIIPLDAAVTLAANGGNTTMQVFASTVGSDANLSSGVVSNADVTPSPPPDLVITVASVVQGTDPGSGPTQTHSKFFDLSLALAYLAKLNIKLSCFWTLVKISYIDQQPNPADHCWIRLKTSAQEKEAMLSLLDGDRSRYYWGALWLMECMNTMVAVHSEPVNILVEILAAWFALRNGSGQYVGNKLSLLRLSGSRIKPLGFPSWLNTEVNENDAEGFDLLDAKNVGYLATIADNTPQESYFSAARGVTKLVINALMISKWVDYTSSQDVAKMITSKGTLTDPMLTDELAYSRIQEVFKANLGLFTATKRIGNIQMKFPAFGTAKTGLTQLEAASAWAANYTDDLDSVTVTGGITEE
jgi:hypothetical protein